MAKEESKFEAPKIGDTVNHVAPHSLITTKVKVVEVHEEHDGRIITVEVPGKKINKDGDEVAVPTKVKVPWRPKEKLAGGTWHFALIALLLSLAFNAVGAIPTYHTLSAAGNAAAPAQVIFPADPNSQIRLVSLFYRNDTNNAQFLISSGTTAYTVAFTNAATTTTTNVIDSTNGLSLTGVILQHNGVDYTNTVTSYGNTGTGNLILSGVTITNTTTTYGIYGQGPVGVAATNVSYVVIASGGWGVFPSIGDEIYLMASSTTFPCGATNTINSYVGDDIYSGNYGRPLEIQLTPALATNNIYSASTHYDSASQP